MSGATKRVIIRAALALVLVGGGMWFLASGDSGSDTTGTGPPGGPGTATGDGACESLHEGHAVMAWNPTSADEMVEAGCGWPYEPYATSTDGGEEDPAIGVEFEPRLYAELSDALGALGLGLCSVNTLPDEPGDGFVFGFRYDAAEPGCPDFTATVELTAREYVTRAHRDAAANALDDPDAIVLGRWVLSTDGPDQERIDELNAHLRELGGLPLDGG